jgi:hypothetical protein
MFRFPVCSVGVEQVKGKEGRMKEGREGRKRRKEWRGSWMGE